MLNGKQKRFLRGEGSLLKPIVAIGKEGLTLSLIKECEQQLAANELIKVRAQKNALQDVRELASETADMTKSELVGVVGRNFLLYRINPEKQQINLP